MVKYKIARVFCTDGPHIIDFIREALGQWKYEHGPDLPGGRTLGMSDLDFFGDTILSIEQGLFLDSLSVEPTREPLHNVK